MEPVPPRADSGRGSNAADDGRRARRVPGPVGHDIPLLCAGSILILLPTLIVFILFQRQVVTALLQGSVRDDAHARRGAALDRSTCSGPTGGVERASARWSTRSHELRTPRSRGRMRRLRGGTKVVDLWGGMADARTGRACRTTAGGCLLVTKGVMAICADLLVEDGRSTWTRRSPLLAGVRPSAARGDHGAARPGPTEPALRPWIGSHLRRMCSHGTRSPRRSRPNGPAARPRTTGTPTTRWLSAGSSARSSGASRAPPGPFSKRWAPAGLSSWIGRANRERDNGRLDGATALGRRPRLARGSSRAAAIRLGASRDDVRGLRLPMDNGDVMFNDPAIQAAEIPGANGIVSQRRWLGCTPRAFRTSTAPGYATPPRSRMGSSVLSAGRQLSGSRRWRPLGDWVPARLAPAQPLLGPGSFGHGGRRAASVRRPRPRWASATSTIRWAATATARPRARGGRPGRLLMPEVDRRCRGEPLCARAPAA